MLALLAAIFNTKYFSGQTEKQLWLKRYGGADTVKLFRIILESKGPSYALVIESDSLANTAKGQINPRAAGALLFFNSMFPMMLGFTLHQEQAGIAQMIDAKATGRAAASGRWDAHIAVLLADTCGKEGQTAAGLRAGFGFSMGGTMNQNLIAVSLNDIVLATLVFVSPRFRLRRPR